MLGISEYRHRLMRTSDFVAKADSELSPIFWPTFVHPFQFNKAFRKKAYLLIHMIERRVGEDQFLEILSKILNSEKGPKTRISTHSFLRMIKKNSSVDFKSFEKQWIYGKGHLNISCGFNYNKKKQNTEFALQQETTEEERFSGSLVVRVNEFDGTYNHVVTFDEMTHSYDFPCNSRLRKNRKKRIQYTNGEELEIDLTKRENPLLWLRIDPNVDWAPASVSFRQPEYMWIFQLQLDRDVIAQQEAIQALKNFPFSESSVFALIGCINQQPVPFFYRIRCMAAKTVGAFYNMEHNISGAKELIELYKTQFFDQTQRALPDPNNFHDFPLYFIRRSILQGLTKARDYLGDCPTFVQDFLMLLLKNNDNSDNQFSDCFFLADLIVALAKTASSTNNSGAKVHKQIKRILDFERLVNTYQATITRACLKALCILMRKDLIEIDESLFLGYARPHNFMKLRIMAYKSLLLLSNNKPAHLAPVLELLGKTSEVPRLKYKLLSFWTEKVRSGVLEAAFLRQINPENQSLLERIWNLLNTEAYDFRLKAATYEFFKTIWRLGVPQCFVPNKIVGIKRKIEAKTTNTGKLHIRKSIDPLLSSSAPKIRKITSSASQTTLPLFSSATIVHPQSTSSSGSSSSLALEHSAFETSSGLAADIPSLPFNLPYDLPIEGSLEQIQSPSSKPASEPKKSKAVYLKTQSWTHPNIPQKTEKKSLKSSKSSSLSSSSASSSLGAAISSSSSSVSSAPSTLKLKPVSEKPIAENQEPPTISSPGLKIRFKVSSD